MFSLLIDAFIFLCQWAGGVSLLMWALMLAYEWVDIRRARKDYEASEAEEIIRQADEINGWSQPQQDYQAYKEKYLGKPS